MTISVSAPYSGAFGPVFDKLFDEGPKLWQAKVNATGGIHGRQIVLNKVENKLSVDGAVAACKEVQSNGSFMNMILVGFVNEDDCEDAAGIPVFDFALNGIETDWKFVFGVQYQPLFAPLIASALNGAFTGAATHKLGILYASDIPGSVSSYKALEAELKKQGRSFADTEAVMTMQTSFVSEMSRLKSSGAETVVLFVSVAGPSIVRDAKAIDYTPKWLNIGGADDYSSMAAQEAFDGMIGMRPWTTTETAAYSAYVATLREYNGDSAARGATSGASADYGFADIVGKVLQTAGRDLTRQSFVEAAETIENYDNGLLPPFTLKGQPNPVGLQGMFPLVCCNPDWTWKSTGPAVRSF